MLILLFCANQDVPMTAVALNWIMCKGAFWREGIDYHADIVAIFPFAKGAIPLPGARNAQQAEQNAQCLGWRLTNEEIAALEEKSQVGGNNFWQQASHHCAPEGDALEIAC